MFKNEVASSLVAEKASTIDKILDELYKQHYNPHHTPNITVVMLDTAEEELDSLIISAYRDRISMSS